MRSPNRTSWRFDAHETPSEVWIAALLSLGTSLLVTSVASAATSHYLPSPYLCFDTSTTTATGDCAGDDSPFKSIAFSYFHLEDFEDGALNTPGVSAIPTPGGGGTLSVLAPQSVTDSVDEDDGAIDGSGNGGRSLFTNKGVAGIIISFDVNVLGQLPTYVGMVHTDGLLSPGDTVWLEAFGPGGSPLDVLMGQIQGDSQYTGGTAEDAFVGVADPGGIESVKIRVAYGGPGLEIDHLQYGVSTQAAPLLGPLGLGILGSSLLWYGLQRIAAPPRRRARG